MEHRYWHFHLTDKSSGTILLDSQHKSSEGNKGFGNKFRAEKCARNNAFEIKNKTKIEFFGLFLFEVYYTDLPDNHQVIILLNQKTK